MSTRLLDRLILGSSLILMGVSIWVFALIDAQIPMGPLRGALMLLASMALMAGATAAELAREALQEDRDVQAG